MPEEKKPVQVKIPDDVLKGVYANTMMIAHTKEEFFIDFLNTFPPQAIVNARIIISPGHLKRIVGVMKTNLDRYEASFGEITEAKDPKEEEIVH